jgi:hypothetical protein
LPLSIYLQIQTAAATKAATAAATAATVQTLPGGVQVLPGGFQFRPPEQAVEASNAVSNSLATLKANLMSGMGSVKDAGGDGTPSIDFDINSLSTSPVIPALVDSLHLKEYGGWYVAAAMAITASQQRSAGREEASKEFESELGVARQKANEAASAAEVAAEGARMAKSLAMKMKEASPRKDPKQDMLEKGRMELIQVEKVRLCVEKFIAVVKGINCSQKQFNTTCIFFR